jgi:dienelactone hydrolase
MASFSKHLIWLLSIFIVLATSPVWAGPQKYKPVKFPSANPSATAISGLILKPQGPGPFPAVVMLHGCSGMLTKSGKLKKRPTQWARLLVAQGYLVLLADSFSPRGHRSICRIKNRPVHPNIERPFDAYGALQYLQTRSDVRAARIALMGWSNGAMTLLWTIKAGATQRPTNLRHDFRAAIGFYPGCVQISKTPYATQIPTLLQIGGADDWTLPKPCLRMVSSARSRGSPMRADTHAGAYHNFDHPTSKVKTVITRNSVYKSGQKQVHVGSNPKARLAAIENVKAYLAKHLGN